MSGYDIGKAVASVFVVCVLASIAWVLVEEFVR